MDTNLWEFKHAPTTFDDIIFDADFKLKAKKIIKDIPNITIAGPPGVGKGTLIEVLRHESPDIDIMKINGSDDTGVDVVRTKIKPYAEGMGLNGQVKIVYLNEADRLTINAQDSLRDLIEKTHDITRFILLCNYPERLTKELLSRCPLIIIPDPPIKDIAKRCIDILKKEGVKYDPRDVISLVKSTYPDIRHTINMLKYNVVDGVLSNSIQIKSLNTMYDDVLVAMKSKDPSKVRKVLRSSPIDYIRLYEYLYSVIMDSPKDVFNSDMGALLHITEGSYRNDVVSIKELSFMNMFMKMVKEGIV